MKKRYYIDFEFIEGFRRFIWWLPSWLWFNKPYWHIEMISIGVYCNDGRSYYAINKNFNPRWASEWVKENVISKLSPRTIGEPQLNTFFDPEIGTSATTIFSEPNPEYKSMDLIKLDVLDFIGAGLYHERWGDGANVFFKDKWRVYDDPEFYGYYSDYDWVLFCTMFGTMMDLPDGMPMYCIDLKQMLDEKALQTMRDGFIDNAEGKVNYPTSIKEAISWLTNSAKYPVQKNEHRADADAEWNFRLHKFIETIV